MNELSLFTGGGGGLLATKWLLGWTAVCYVERERYPVEILKARIKDGYLDDAPIWDDVRTFDGRHWRGCVDVITAGFPCQPFSSAGKRQADADDRNGWPDTIRIIREVQPRYAFLENVPGLLNATSPDGLRYFGTILSDLAACGYDARWRVLSAAEVGAPHKRDRLWIVAYDSSTRASRAPRGERELRREKVPAAKRERFWDKSGNGGKDVPNPDRPNQGRRLVTQRGPDQRDTQPSGDGTEGDVANADSTRLSNPKQERQLSESATERGIQPSNLPNPSSVGQAERGNAGLQSAARPERPGADNGSRAPINERGQWWATEPPLGRVVTGMADRVGQLKALGNGQVSLVAATAWRLLTEDL